MWNEISEAEKQSIEKGIEDVKYGKIKAHAEIKNPYEEWLERSLE